MFSLLSPIALWLAPLIAVPLAIALMGRAEPKTRDFPSLLPVQESLRNAMKRHRLRNWLQLILRTLIVLCLLLAAAGPVWRGRGGDASSVLTLPSTIGFLFPNGATASIPVSALSNEGAAGSSNRTLYDRFSALQKGMDSLSRLNQGRLITEPLFGQGSLWNGESNVVNEGGAGSVLKGPARLGNFDIALKRLLNQVEDQVDEASKSNSPTHLFIPVSFARDLTSLARTAGPWLAAHPQARLIVLDYGKPASRLHAYGVPRAATNRDEGMLSLQTRVFSSDPLRWTPASVNLGSRNSQTSGNSLDVRRVDGDAALSLALPGFDPGAGASTQWLAGTLSLEETQPKVYAYTSRAVSYRVPPPATLCHIGSREAFVSRATLGESGSRLKIQSLASGTNQALDRSEPDCDLLYLADPPEANASLFSRAAAVIRSGGLVILETGRHTDPVLWNRSLLSPLGAGLLTDRVTSATSMSAVTPPNELKNLRALGIRSERWGKPGGSITRFGLRPVPGTMSLLTTEDGKNSLLAYQRIGGGGLLLWTTSLSDPEWSDLGLGPWAALLHQTLIERSWSTDVVAEDVDTDSTYWWPAPNGDPEAVPEVIDPEGRDFPRVRAEPGGFVLGPFDQPGLYRIEDRNSTTNGLTSGRRRANGERIQEAWLAVNVAEAPPLPRSEDRDSFWTIVKQAEEPGSEASIRSQIRFLDSEKDWRTLYGGVNLRGVLLMLAALLLFAEGVVTLRLATASRSEA